MTLSTTRIIVSIVVFSLFAASASAADMQDAVAVTKPVTTNDTAELDRDLAVSAHLAASAHTAAVEDAIEAVLAANKLDLDIRLIGQTSVNIVDGP